MDPQTISQLIILAVLLLLSAFFSSSETAISSVSKVTARSLEEAGQKHAKLLNKILENYDRVLSTILIGNNLVNIYASALVTTITLRLWGNVYVSLATGILTLIVLIFGEIVPKTVARRNAQRLALFYAVPINFLTVIFTPLVFLVTKIADFFLLIMGQKGAEQATITENELRTYVDVSHEEGVIESDEKKIINNIFDFGDSVAKDIMIPKIDMTMISQDAKYDDVKALFTETMYTRIPVYGEDIDNLLGFLNVKDLLLLKKKSDFNLKSLIRKPYYTYEYKKTNDLMLEMRKTSNSLAFVMSEYGEVVGMITMEDLLEEIVGELRDEFDADEADFIKPVDGVENCYSIRGNVKLEDINDQLSTDFHSEDYDSIAGLVLGELNRLPKDKESIVLEDGTSLTVQGVKQNRILRVIVKLPIKSEPENSENE